MNKPYRAPVILFCVVLVGGLLGNELYQWMLPRWKLKATQEALRQMHITLENHYIKHFGYPNASGVKGERMEYKSGITLGRAPWKLLPKEKISSRVMQQVRQTYYGSDGKDNWILCHPGPDGRLNTELEAWIAEAGDNWIDSLAEHSEKIMIYDPTNGTLSSGDMIRVGP